MSQIYDISGSTFVVPCRYSATITSFTSKSHEFNLVINYPKLLTLLDIGFITIPRKAKKGALKGFRTRLHEIMPQMKNLTHDEIESLVDERNEDILSV